IRVRLEGRLLEYFGAQAHRVGEAVFTFDAELARAGLGERRLAEPESLFLLACIDAARGRLRLLDHLGDVPTRTLVLVRIAACRLDVQLRALGQLIVRIDADQVAAGARRFVVHGRDADLAIRPAEVQYRARTAHDRVAALPFHLVLDDDE